MKICGAVSTRLPTLTSVGETKLPSPLMYSSVLRLPSQSVRLLTEAPTTLSLRALTAFMSTVTGPLTHDAELGGVAGRPGGAGAGHQRLGGRAAIVDAGAAQMLALDQRDLLAGAGQPRREERPGLAGTDDDGVELF